MANCSSLSKDACQLDYLGIKYKGCSGDLIEAIGSFAERIGSEEFGSFHLKDLLAALAFVIEAE